MYDVIIVDGNNFAQRALHAHSRLSVKKESGRIGTGLIYGFYDIVLTMLNQLEGNPKLYVVWDKGRNKRKKIYPEYKSGRDKKDVDPKKQKKKDEMKLELKKQMNMIHHILKLNGITQAYVPGEEADDVIGTLAYRFKKQGKNVLIASGDHDMFQLIDEGIELYLARTGGNNTFWDVSKFEKKNGLNPKKMVDVMSLMGDTGDSVPGVNGIGEKKALKIVINNLDIVPNILSDKLNSEAQISGVNDKERELVLNNFETIKLAHSLVKIDCDMKGLKFKKPKRDMEALEEIFDFLEFNSFLGKSKWEEIERMN